MSAATYQPPTLTLRLDQSHWASQTELVGVAHGDAAFQDAAIFQLPDPAPARVHREGERF